LGKSKNTKKNSNIDLKSSTINLSLNIIIFLLIAVIVYLSFSIFMKLGTDSPVDIKVSNKPKPDEIIQMEVLNGCGVNGVAERFTDFLRERNFDVVSTGNYNSFNIDESLVIDRIGNIANAEKVAEDLGISKERVITQKNEDYFLDVSLIIGKDYFKLKPIKGE
jgi:hypothetical protein